MEKRMVGVLEKLRDQRWESKGHPGYFGSKRNEKFAKWDEEFGKGNWRIVWKLKDGKRLTYEEILDVYTQGYGEYFRGHPQDVRDITGRFSYGYDETPQAPTDAMDPYALWNQPGKANQFHHVAFNRALAEIIGRYPFQNPDDCPPIQVREKMKGTPPDQQPAGAKWSPGRIMCPADIREKIPDVAVLNQWWESGSIEDLYQRAKVLEVKRPFLLRRGRALPKK